MYALPGQLLLPGYPQETGIGTGGQHHSLGSILPLIGDHCLRLCLQIQSTDFGINGFRTKPLCLLLHIHPQQKTLNAIGKAGVVVDLVGQCHLTANRHSLHHRNTQTGSGGVKGSGISARAAADDHHVENIILHIFTPPCVFLQYTHLLRKVL